MSFTDGITQALGNSKTEVEVGIGGFRFFAKVSEATNYSNVVPVDVLEDGTNSTDDIINNPIGVSIEGVVGDTFISTPQASTVIGKDFSLVGEVSEFLPEKSQQQLQRISQIDDQVNDAILIAERAERIGNNVYEFFAGAPGGKTQKEQFVEYMESIYFGRQPINISTEYRDYSNMAMEDLVISSNNQDGEIKFSVKFLQINYLPLIYTEVSNNYSSPSQSMSGKVSSNANKGGQNPEVNQEKSLLSSLIGG